MTLLPNDLYEQPFAPLAVELVVEDMLPRAEVERAIRYRHNDLPAHDLPFQMGVGVILIAVVAVLAVGLLRGKLLQPDLIVMVQSRLVVVDKHRSGYVHCRAEGEAVLHATLRHQPLDFLMDGNDGPSFGYFHPYLFCQVFHDSLSLEPLCLIVQRTMPGSGKLGIPGSVPCMPSLGESTHSKGDRFTATGKE